MAECDWLGQFGYDEAKVHNVFESTKFICNISKILVSL